ncbi:hypothetical protein Acr_00g0022700 [Actinidia rufa]|uniref:C2 domain-containing protein n=1 Tax=Actinidia rufa TaxID=165716 RepID=A0A7J0DCT5_9ERIC|nr:hypothetical protein Acr_00g0022700 [Actinidia rufa]
MPRGMLVVQLMNAGGLEDTDLLRKGYRVVLGIAMKTMTIGAQIQMDPYVILAWTGQKHKSSVASGKGSEPEWNEKFVFTLADDTKELRIKIMDRDFGYEDDFVGEAM